MKFIIFKLF